MSRFRRALVSLVAGLLVLTLGPSTTASAVSAQPVWAFGDSITAGTWLTDPATQSWPSQLDALMGPGQQVRNLGVGGQAMAYAPNGIQRGDDYVKQVLTGTPADQLPATILLALGINDLIQSPNDMYTTRLATFNLVGWIGTNYPGVRVFVVTLTPLRSDAGYADALSARRAVYNDWARAQWAPYGQLLDVGDTLTGGATYADLRWYWDQLHPNAAGAEQYAIGAFTFLHQKGIV